MNGLIGFIILLLIVVWIMSKAKGEANDYNRKIEQRERAKQKRIEQERIRKLDAEIKQLDEDIRYYEHGEEDEDVND